MVLIPRSECGVPPEPAHTPESLKRQAERARRLADTVPWDEAADRLRAYAEELEAMAADAMEKNGAPTR
jgi:hypothetical protein